MEPRAVWKYTFDSLNQSLSMPERSNIVHIDYPSMWAVVTPAFMDRGLMMVRHFQWFETGEMSGQIRRPLYLATAMIEGRMYHLFETRRPVRMGN